MTLIAREGALAPSFAWDMDPTDPMIRQAQAASKPAQAPRARKTSGSKSSAATTRATTYATTRAADVLTRAPSGRHFPDNPKPSDHVLFLHGGAGSGSRWVCLRRLQAVDEQTTIDGVRNTPSVKVSVPSLLQYVDRLADEPNLYLAQADFFWGPKGDKNRQRSNANYLNTIGTVFVDLDIYNNPRWNGVPVEDVANELRATCLRAGVPAPVIISSGRGLYANWKLDWRLNLRDFKQHQRWSRLQTQMMALLHEFAPDPKVRDATRILRLVGSVNGRSGTRVRVLHDDGAVHMFEHLEHCARDLSDTMYAPAAKSGVKKAAKTEGAAKKAPKATKTAQKDSAAPAHATGSAHDIAVDAPLSDPQALAYLEQMLTDDEPLIEHMTRTRAHQYRVFRDIARVVLARGGIGYGNRDEFIFWMLVMRFNAGLYAPDELQGLAGRFAGLTQGALNIWDAGMLTSLYGRMRDQAERHGLPLTRNPIIRTVGAFTAVRSFEVSVSGSRGKMGYGEGYLRPRVYTPKVATLLARLAITAEEQESLECLYGEEERRRRRRLKGAAVRKVARDTQIIAQHQVGARTLSRIAKRHKVSVATAYRVLARQPEVAEKAQAREKELSNKRAAAIAISRAQPELSLRQLAAQVDAAPTTVHRWLNGARRAAQKSQEMVRAKRVNLALRELALGGKKTLSKRTKKLAGPGPSHIAPVSSSVIQAVPLSQNVSDSIKGEGRGGAVGSVRQVTQGTQESRVATGQVRREGSRVFDFMQDIADRKRRRQARLERERSQSSLPTVDLQSIGASGYWELAQARCSQRALLDMAIPEIPGIDENPVLLLEAVGLIQVTMDAARDAEVAPADMARLPATLEQMFIISGTVEASEALSMLTCGIQCPVVIELIEEAYSEVKRLTVMSQRMAQEQDAGHAE